MNGSNSAACARAMLLLALLLIGTSWGQNQPRYQSISSDGAKPWIRDVNQLTEQERQQRIQGYRANQSSARITTQSAPKIVKARVVRERRKAPESQPQRTSIEARYIMLRPKDPIPGTRTPPPKRPNDAYAPYRNRQEYEAAAAKAAWKPTPKSIALARKAREQTRARALANARAKSTAVSKRSVAKSRSSKRPAPKSAPKRQAPAPRSVKDPELPPPDSRRAVDSSLFPD